MILSIAAIITGIACVLCCVVIYYFVQLKKLKRKLNIDNKDGFIKALGEGYKSRPLDTETYRYKWRKGVFIIRADFDKRGILKGEKKISRKFSDPKR